MPLRRLPLLVLILVLAACGDPTGEPARPAPASVGARPQPAPQAVTVTIDAGTVLAVNGETAVPDGLFGVTAYAGASAATEESWRPQLRRSGIRWAGLPAHPEWVFGKDLPLDLPAGWADGEQAAAMLERSHGGYRIPACARAWRDLGIEPMLYLLGYTGKLDGGVDAAGKHVIPDFPSDIPAAARLWAEYVALVRRADPELTWLHLGNEPNASWWKLKRYGGDYAEVFRAVSKAVKERNPGVRIGGPVPCWPPSWPPAQDGCPDWYTWDQWTRPFLDGVGKDLDFFDFHLYEAGPSVGSEEVQTVANAMWLKSGRRVPVLITEYGVYLKPEDLLSSARVWRRRIDPWQGQLMDLLEVQPDVVPSLQPHDLFADAGGKFTFLKGRDPDDQFPLARAYRVWEPLRGTRLAVRCSGSPVRAFASLHADELTGARSLALVLVNPGRAPQRVALDWRGLAPGAGPVRQRFIRLVDPLGQAGAGSAVPEGFQDTTAGGVNGGGAAAVPRPAGGATAAPDGSRIESGESVSDGLAAVIDLAADETRSLAIPLAPAAAAPAQARWIRTVYGSEVHREFAQPGATVAVVFDAAAIDRQGADGAELRVGLLGARAGDRLEVAFDGTTAVLAPEFFQRLRLPRPPAAAGPLTAVFTLRARGNPEQRPQRLRLGSAVLAIEGAGAWSAPAPQPPASGAAVVRAWSFEPNRRIVAGEDPWSGLGQALADLPLNEALQAREAPARLAAAGTGGVQRSPCEAVAFRVPCTGWYRVEAAGRLTARTNPTAGHALLSLYALAQDRAAVRTFAALPLNVPGGFGGHPQDFTWTGTVRLRAGWTLAMGLQTVSPGPANAGRSEVEPARFRCELLATEPAGR